MSVVTLSTEHLSILAVAANDGDGEYVVRRDWNKPWGADHALMKDLESRGLMQISSAERVEPTKQWCRRSQITEAGRAASSAATES